MLTDTNFMKNVTYDLISFNLLLALWLHVQQKQEVNFFIKTKFFSMSISLQNIYTLSTFGYGFYLLSKYG